MGDTLVLTAAGDIVVGDHVWTDESLYRVWSVEPDVYRRIVTLHLEGAKRDLVDVPIARLIPREMLS